MQTAEEVREEILAWLTTAELSFRLYTHAHADTIDDCVRMPFINDGVTICKNVFLCNRQQTRYYLLLLRPHTPFRTAVVSKSLGVSRLSFAPEAALHDYNIPLMLNHTVVDIQGRERLTGVTVAKVDEHRKPIPGTETHFDCDTLLLSVGLIPENELSKQAGVPLSSATQGAVVDDTLQTEIPGIFACGNVLHGGCGGRADTEKADVPGIGKPLGCGRKRGGHNQLIGFHQNGDVVVQHFLDHHIRRVHVGNDTAG